MGLKTIAFGIIIFIAVVTLPIYMIINHQVYTTKTAQGLYDYEQSELHSQKSAISILNASYVKFPDFNTTIFIKNIGSFPLKINQTFPYFNGTRIPNSNLSRRLFRDLTNPGLWDPGEILELEANHKLKVASYEITVTSQYGTKTTVPFDPELPINIYRSQPNPVDPLENITFMQVGLVFYNPNGRAVNVWNVTDNWDLDGVINSTMYSCRPSPCEPDIANNRFKWTGNYTIASESQLTFFYRININESLMGVANATAIGYSENGNIYSNHKANISFTSNAGTAFIDIKTGDLSYNSGIGKINGTVNQSFTIRINETAGTSSLKAGQYIIIPISDQIEYFGSESPYVTKNETHIVYELQNDLTLSSEVFGFWAILPDFHMPALFNVSMNGTDGSGAVHNDDFEILVTTDGVGPEIGTFKQNDSVMFYNQSINLSVSVNDSSGVAGVMFIIDGKTYKTSNIGDIYYTEVQCILSRHYTWNLTIAEDIRGFVSNKSTEINFTCDAVPELKIYREQPLGCSEGKKMNVRFNVYVPDKPYNIAENFTIVDDYPDTWTILSQPDNSWLSGGRIFLNMSSLSINKTNSTNYTIECGSEGNVNFTGYLNFSYTLGHNQSNITTDPFTVNVNNSIPFFDVEFTTENGSDSTFTNRSLDGLSTANITIRNIGGQGAIETPLIYRWEYDESYFLVSDISNSNCSIINFDNHKAINCSIKIPKDQSKSFTFKLSPLLKSTYFALSNSTISN